MSPRRSSRARSAQNPPGSTTHTNSTSSQTSNTKGDRNTRAYNGARNNTISPRDTPTANSESADDAESSSRSAHIAESSLPPRRSRRGNENDPQEKGPKMTTDDYGEGEEEAIEEEITRCICGHTEYPGPSAVVREHWISSEPITEDTGNFFVQCDKCHVWQHGGCMGLVDESIIPDEYYCEQCKPEYHEIKKSATGKSSWYLPVRQAEGISDRSTPLSGTNTSRRISAKHKALENTKRRATLNSRGAYDEDEMLRRAIEESKEMGSLGKRTRDDSEEQKPAVKRQRTGSFASSAGSVGSASPGADSGEGRSSAHGNAKQNGTKLRGAAAKNSREKEARDKQKEQVAAQRAEAASKRNARSERRRGDDSPPPTPTLSPTKPATTASSSSKPKAETPPVGKGALQRKGGRPPTRRGRLGRNQYTREQNMGDLSDTPMRDGSRDRHGDSPRTHTNGTLNGESGRSSKAKTHPARTSMNEMKRRVAAILEFVGHAQTERGNQLQTKGSASDSGGGSRSSGRSSLKGTSTPNGATASSNLPITANLVKAVTESLEEANDQKETATLGSESDKDTITIPSQHVKPEREFVDMNAVEMMETLTKDLVTWQSVYGVYAR